MQIHTGLILIDAMEAKHRNMIVVAAVGILIAVGVHLTQEFRFYNIESNDLFLYDFADIWSRLLQTGGLATVLASALTQFMRIPFAGTIIATAVYLSVWWLTRSVLRHRTESAVMDGFAFLPSAFLFLCMENDYYRFQGHVAFLLAMIALAAYVSVPKEKVWARAALGLLMVPVLYQTAGSVAVMYAASVMLWEITERGWKGLWAVVYPAVMLVTAYIYVDNSRVSDWEHALTPFMYYDWPSTYFFPVYAWTMVPVLVLAAWVVSLIRMKPSYVKAVAVVGLAVSFFLAGNFYSQVHSRTFYRMIQEQYWAENQEWDKIIKTADRRQPTFLVSYLNLALAHKGQLVQNFRYYNPQDLSSLMYPTPNLKTGLSLQSTVYMAWGYLGSARKAAFDGNVVTPGSRHPRQLQALIKINLVMGAHDVAEKYISILERTLFYKGWASSMRVFLGNEEAVKADKEMGMMYASLPLTDEYARLDGIVGDMRDIHEACPDNVILSQFYELYKILEGAQ